MYTQRVFSPINAIQFSIIQIIIFTVYSTLIVVLFTSYGFEWLKIPWVPLTLIGTAVAFYLGFKNNSAYDRTWEARKIWGGIVNSSRSWGSMVKGFVTDEFASEDVSQAEIEQIQKRMIYLHIAWLYRLKRQLRVIKPWEHSRRLNHRYRKHMAELFPNDDPETELKKFMSSKEVEHLLNSSNPCTRLIDKQSEDLRDLKRRGLIDDFRHMELQKMLTEFYTLQGKCERIKNFPLPRHYASLSVYFVYIFLFLLPLGLLSVCDAAGASSQTIWFAIPFSVLISWIFWMMEGAGDYAENPFEGLAFDTPMDSLTRTIEIDMREMLGETDVPPPITPKEGIVM
jgi:putative membrane protein